METIIVSSLMGSFIILSYTLGLINGKKIVNNQPIELPKIEPIKAIKVIKKKIENNKEEKKVKQEQDKLNQILQNIENYDGTNIGQKAVK